MSLYSPDKPKDKLKYLEERLESFERSTGWWDVEDFGSMSNTVRKLKDADNQLAIAALIISLAALVISVVGMCK